MKDHPYIRMGHLKIFDHLILGIVKLQLKKKHLQLDHSSIASFAFTSWSQIRENLINGDLDGAFMTIPYAMRLFDEGLDIRLLMFAHRSGSIIVKKNRPGIKNIRGFKDKTVLVPSRFSLQSMLTHRLITATGPSLSCYNAADSEVFQESVPQALMPSMLKNDDDDDIAGFCAEEPFGTIAVQEGIAKIICTTDQLWQNHPCCAFILKNDIIERFPDAVDELITVFLNAAQKIESEKKDLFYSAMHDFIGHNQDLELLSHAFSNSGIHYTPALLKPDFALLEIIQEYMVTTMKTLPSKIDLTRFVNDSFIRSTGVLYNVEN